MYKELTKTDTQCLWFCLDCLESRRTGRSLMLQELSSALSSLKEQLIEEFERRVAWVLDETKKALATALGDMVPRAIAQTHEQKEPFVE